MEKRAVEKAGCERRLFGNAQSDSEKGLFGNAQSLKQSSLRCGTRFVGAAEGARSGRMRRLAALCISTTPPAA